MRERWARHSVGIAFALLAAVTVLWPTLAGAGGGGHGACSGFAQGATVETFDNCFAGTAHFVEPDSTVTVKNSGSLAHNLTAVDRSVTTGNLDPGESTTIEVGGPGAVRIYCTLHGTDQGGGMSGVLLVGGDTTEGTAPADVELASTRSDAAPPSSDGLSGMARFALIVGVVGAGLGAAALTMQLVVARSRR